MRLAELLSKLTKRALDSAVLWRFVGVGLRAGGNILLLPLVLRTLPSEHLGLWYVFSSIGAFVLLLDLGFSPAAGRAVAYLWAGSSDLRPFGVVEVASKEAGSPNIKTLTALLCTLRVYYIGLSLVMLLLLGTAGTYYVYTQVSMLEEWRILLGAWAIFGTANSLAMYVAYWSTALPSVGGVQIASRLGVACYAVQFLVSASGLLLGWGLYALVLGVTTSNLLLLILQASAAKKITGIFRLPIAGADATFLKILWPQAWRSAASTFGGVLGTYGNILVCTSALGLLDAASYSLTVQVVALVITLAAVCVDVKLPMFSSLRAIGDIPAIAHLFVQRMRWAILLYIFGSLGVVFIAPPLLKVIGANTELLPTPAMLIVITIGFLDLHQSRCSLLVQSSNQNPFLWQYLGTGVATIALSSVLVRTNGVQGLAFAQLLVLVSCNAWWMPKHALASMHLSILTYARQLFSLPMPCSLMNNHQRGTS